MSLKKLSQNQNIGIQLSRLLEQERMFHAFLFAGGSEESRKALGNAFAKAILCPEAKGDYCGICPSCRKFDDGNQEDLIRIVKPSDKVSILAGQIEELQQRLSFMSYGHAYAVMIEEAQLMNQQAQNKLLKSLEEPQADAVFILLAESTESLLPTVVSRCSTYWLEEAELKTPDELKKAAADLVKLILKKEAFYRKRNCLKPILDAKEEGREMALEFLLALEERIRGELLIAAAFKKAEDIACLLKAEEACKDARRYLKQVHNVGYTLKQLCLRV